MASIFDQLWKLGPAEFLLRAIIVAIAGDALLLAFILIRRAYRKQYFAKRDARVFEFRQKWDALISEDLPFESWRNKPFDRRIVETIALDALEGASPLEGARLLKFLRASGLIEKRIFEARKHTGWRRMRALVALGRTRAPEGIPALAEGLRDRDMETRLAALRGLSRTAAPEAGKEILAWASEVGLTVPSLPLQSALIQCCAERPKMLLPYLQHAEGPLREVLGRVLGEIATPSLGMELLQFVDDDIDELRGAVARAMSHAAPGLGMDVLKELVHDSVWFVRLRAIVSLREISDPRVIPTLLEGLTDSNRLVRLRAAEGLVEFKEKMGNIFEKVAASGDRYAVHAYLTALENADLCADLELEITTNTALDNEQRTQLLDVLHGGALAPLKTGTLPTRPATAQSR
jgi:HEAT repeat protein